MYAVLDPATGNPRLILSGRRLVTPSGETLSDAALLPRADLVARGVYPVTDPGKPDPALYRVTGQRVEIDGDGATLVYDAEPIPAEEIASAQFAALRTERDARLAAALAILDRHRNQVDFGLPSTLTAEQATAWAVYAQALRDLPEDTADPAAPEWPKAPNEETV